MVLFSCVLFREKVKRGGLPICCGSLVKGGLRLFLVNSCSPYAFVLETYHTSVLCLLVFFLLGKMSKAVAFRPFVIAIKEGRSILALLLVM